MLTAEKLLLSDTSQKILKAIQKIIIIESVHPYIATRFPVNTQAEYELRNTRLTSNRIYEGQPESNEQHFFIN
jgi:hypothetical protein